MYPSFNCNPTDKIISFFHFYELEYVKCCQSDTMGNTNLSVFWKNISI